MLSALIQTEHSYPAVPLVGQLVHQRFVLPGPLVLGKGPLRVQRPWRIGDRTVSRRSEPSSRAALIGEQPNPWELLHPQDATSRHRGANLVNASVTFWEATAPVKLPASYCPRSG